MQPQISARRIGREGEPIVIVDDFAPDPEALRSFATEVSYGPAGEHYPGLRAPLPSGYLGAAAETLATVFAEAFGATTRARVVDASFSIVTSAPEALSLAQRLPHVDALEPGRLAMVQYLGADELGGTAFYRHIATGFETIDATRADEYFASLHRQVKEHTPTQYIAQSTPLFDQIDAVPARFNRAIFYRSRLLHSGAIPPGAALSPDPSKGRLTVTGFFALE